MQLATAHITLAAAFLLFHGKIGNGAEKGKVLVRAQICSLHRCRRLNKDIDSLCGYPKGAINFYIRLQIAVQIAVQIANQ
jgi:hypothetical protein